MNYRKIVIILTVLSAVDIVYAGKVRELESDTAEVLTAEVRRTEPRGLVRTAGIMTFDTMEMCFFPVFSTITLDKDCTSYEAILNITVLGTVMHEAHVVVTTADSAIIYAVPRAMLGRILILIKEGQS